MAISFIGGGNWSKPPTCRKSLTSFITQCYICLHGIEKTKFDCPSVSTWSKSFLINEPFIMVLLTYNKTLEEHYHNRKYSVITCSKAQSSWMSHSGWSGVGSGGLFTICGTGRNGLRRPCFNFASRRSLSRADVGLSNNDLGTLGCSSFLCFCFLAVSRFKVKMVYTSPFNFWIIL